ncbi:MAG: hypothetical protein QW128_01710 [Thermoprotei archaeon]
MNLQEAWIISRITYQEIAFNAMLQTRKHMLDLGRYKNAGSFMRRLKQNAAINKIIVSVFLFIGSLLPYLSLSISKHNLMVTFSIAISVSLLISFALILFYEMQLLPYLINASGVQALRLFPLSDKDVSIISLLTLLRTADYLILAIISSQIMGELIINVPILFMILNLFISLLNIGFAVSVALFLSKLFYKFIYGGSGGFIRFIYTLTWGFGVSIMYFLPGILNNFIPYIENAMFTIHSNISPILLLYPFPLVLSIVNFSNIPLPIFLTGISYFFIVVWSIKSSASFVQNVVFGYKVNLQRFKGNINIKIRKVISAIIIKDIRLASRMPNLAFALALPVLEVIFIITGFSFQVPNFTSIMDYRVFTGMFVGGFLSILVSVLFLSSDLSSIIFISTLPLRTRTVIIAKSFISIITYLPVFTVFLIFSKSFTLYLFILISIIPVLAGSLLSPTIYLLLVSKGRLTAPNIFSSPLHALIPLAVGVITITLPTSVYMFFSSISLSHALIGMSIISLAEIIISIKLLYFLKDL